MIFKKNTSLVQLNLCNKYISFSATLLVCPTRNNLCFLLLDQILINCGKLIISFAFSLRYRPIPARSLGVRITRKQSWGAPVWTPPHPLVLGSTAFSKTSQLRVQKLKAWTERTKTRAWKHLVYDTVPTRFPPSFSKHSNPELSVSSHPTVCRLHRHSPRLWYCVNSFIYVCVLFRYIFPPDYENYQ